MIGNTRTPRMKLAFTQPIEEGKGPFRRVLPTVVKHITGVTKDSTGAPLGNCVVHLFRTSDDALMYQTTSDGSGNFVFTCGLDSYYIVAYLPGSPDVAGVTLNTLQGVDA